MTPSTCHCTFTDLLSLIAVLKICYSYAFIFETEICVLFPIQSGYLYKSSYIIIIVHVLLLQDVIHVHTQKNKTLIIYINAIIILNLI